MSNVNDDLKKIVKAGVGAMAVLVEKGKDLVNELSEKGGEALENAQPLFDELEQKGGEVIRQGKAHSEEFVRNVRQMFDDMKEEGEPINADYVDEVLGDLTDEGLDAVIERINALKARRREEAERAASEATTEPAAEEAAEEAEQSADFEDE